MRIRFALLCSVVWGLAISGVMAQTPALSSIEAPYPAVQSAVRIAGATYGPGAVPYGSAGTPLVMSGKDFGASGTVVFPGPQKGTTVQATVTSWSPSILLVTVPTTATSGLVYVNAEGKNSNGLPFIVTPGTYAGTCPGTPPSSELEITTSSLPNGTVGQAYSATLNATGGTPPYTWSLTGSPLPAGLSLSASSGAITGTPTAVAGPVNLTVKAVDSKTQATDAVLNLTIGSQTLTSATVYSYSVPTSGGFDANGNITKFTDSVMGTWSFGYDALSRLSSAVPGTGAPGAYTGQNLCMNYDSFGNRTQSDFQSTACNPGSDPATAKFNPANQVTWTTVNSAVNGFSYDASGNVTFDGANSYSYDGEGRVCAMQTTVSGYTAAYGYIYDAEGRRVAKGTITPAPAGQTPSCNLATNGFTLTESYVLGQGGEQLTTTNWNGQTGTWARTNVYGEGKLLGTYDTLGLHFHLTDPLGTRRLQTNAQGEPELDCQSLPFGDQMNCFPDPNAPASVDDATPLHFTGKERDSESGNDYFGARYYASTMGRFLSPDWSAKEEPVPYAKLDNPQTLNLYQYMRNNPLGGTDPDGHCCWDEFVGAAGAAGQVLSDTLVGGAKGVWNQVAGVATAINRPIDAALSAAGVDFQFGAVPSATGSTPGQSGAMGGVEVVSYAIPAIDAAKGAQLLSDASKAGDAISMTQAVEKGAAHVDGGVMEETGKGTNFQFRNTTTDASGNTVTKIGRFDVNPADPHVAKEGAHLNLETQVNGKQVGNQHIPIDPNTVRPGDHP